MQRRSLVLLFLVASILAARPLSGQEAEDPRIRLNVAEITIAGRVITQLNTSSVETEPDWDLFLRRVRLGADVVMNDLVSGRVHGEFSGSRIQLADAYMQLDVAPWLDVRAGRWFRPFGTIEQTTSLRLAPIERGVRIRGARDYDLSSLLAALQYTDRDLGIQLRGAPAVAPLGLNYVFAVTNGPLDDQVGSHDSMEYFARFGVEPIADVRVGAGWARRDFARTSGGTIDLEGGNAWVVDVEYGTPGAEPGIHFVAEAATGAYDAFTDEDFAGLQTWVSYRIPLEGEVPLIEPLFRVSHVDIDRIFPQDAAATPPQGGTLYTPGVNLYFGGLNRLMLNYDVFDQNGDGSVSSFKAQFQLSF